MICDACGIPSSTTICGACAQDWDVWLSERRLMLALREAPGVSMSSVCPTCRDTERVGDDLRCPTCCPDGI